MKNWCVWYKYYLCSGDEFWVLVATFYYSDWGTTAYQRAREFAKLPSEHVRLLLEGKTPKGYKE